MGHRLCCPRPPGTHTRSPRNASQTSSLTSSITTLEDYLMMNSPAPLDPDQCIVGSGEIIQVLKQTGKRVYPSSPDVDSSMFHTPRMSFSSGKVDEVCMSSKQVMKKKVRFKLPEEADIILFYTPRETFDDASNH